MGRGTYAADFLGDVVDPLISAAQHHLVDHDFLSACDNAIAADHSNSCAVAKQVSKG